MLIIRHEPKDNAKLRLFCFPYAGGTAAAYRPWNKSLPPEVDLCAIELPGRLTTSTKPIADMKQLIDEIYPDIKSELDRPYIFYGHSFGSIIAYELCKRLQADNLALPQTLFVSSRRAPHIQNSDEATFNLPDDEFIDAMQVKYNAIPDAVLNEPDLLNLLLPMLRADITINELYTGNIEPKLTIPVRLFYGEDDTSVDKNQMMRWAEVTDGPFDVQAFPGGHFFIDSEQEDVVKAVLT